jgi:hypothetical protein
MIGYFEAAEILDAFNSFKELALQYWAARPPDTRDHQQVLHGVPHPETEESTQLREKIARELPRLTTMADKLQVSVHFVSAPPPMIGGPTVPLNVLHAVLNPHEGYRRIYRQEVLDVVHRCIGAAEHNKKQAASRLKRPWFWIIDLIAFVIRMPFLILRKAGLPATIEENVWAQGVKVVFLVIFLWVVTVGFGQKVSVSELLKFFK